MRIAVFADVHGNLLALESVLTDIASRSPDATVNLGDCLSGPLQAAVTADLLMARDFLTIRGNHDRQLLDRPAEQMGPADQAADAQINDTHRAWLATFPATAILDDMFLCHGSPDSDLTYLLEHVGPHGASLASPEQVRDLLRGVSQPVVLCGHTHMQRVVTVADGPLVINPGSVGLPGFYDDVPYPHVIESGSPHARYAILDRSGEHWRVELVAVEYDWASAAALAAKSGSPWAHAIATGYAQTP
jgi:putative phosphoesterase